MPDEQINIEGEAEPHPVLCLDCGHHRDVHYADGCHPWPSREVQFGRQCDCQRFKEEE